MQLIDYRDSRPIFEQIVENFKMQILMGALAPDEQMPSVRTLAVELPANPNTIQKAYAILESEGFIYTVKGRGSFVRKNDALKETKKQELTKRLRAVLDEAKAVGIEAEEIFSALRAETEEVADSDAPDALSA